MKRPFLIACCAIILAATAIRVRCAHNDLWLDEIWSLNLVSQISSPVQVFTKIHHDNNHYLNSLCLYYLGKHGNWPGYRIPSVIAGIGIILMAGVIGRRRNPAAALLCMLLTGFSYVLILYSTEARGYAWVVFFSLLSYHLMDRYLEKQRWQTALLFSVSAIFGFCSHLSFQNFFAAAFIWSSYHFLKSRLGLKHTVRGLFSCYFLPAAFLAALYVLDIRHLVIGGGIPAGLLESYGASLTWALGMPFTGLTKYLICAVTLAILAGGIRMLWRERSDSFVFFLSVILVTPILAAVWKYTGIFDARYDFHVRYFIVGIPFLLILLSLELAALFNRGIPGRMACVFVLVLYFLANSCQLVSLFKYGRGQYGNPIRFLAEHSKGSVVSVTGDYDLSISLVLSFYAPEIITNRSGNYYTHEDVWPQKGTEWFICQKSSMEDPLLPKMVLIDHGTDRYNYELLRIFPSAPLSGLHWFIYHNRAYDVFENN